MSSQSFSNWISQLPEMVGTHGRLNKVPGVSVGVLHDGVISIVTWGNATLEYGTLIKSNTQFQVGSISKTLSAWGVMYLVQTGQLDLDLPVMNYLTRWNPPDESDFKLVTLRRLLSHTAGLNVSGYAGTELDGPRYTLEDSLNGLFSDKLQLVGPVGTFLYSGGGYTLIQLIIEEVTDMTFAQYMSKYILLPLGMTSSSYSIHDLPIGNFASAYDRNLSLLPSFTFVEQAAAGLLTTLEDMVKFLVANCGDLEPVISKNHLDLMWSRISRTVPYGLGYRVHNVAKRKLVMHHGRNRGWFSTFCIAGELSAGIAILTNGDNGDMFTPRILDSWLDMELGELTQGQKYPVTGVAERD